jgi:hypothetical protein
MADGAVGLRVRAGGDRASVAHGDVPQTGAPGRRVPRHSARARPQAPRDENLRDDPVELDAWSEAACVIAHQRTLATFRLDASEQWLSAKVNGYQLLKGAVHLLTPSSSTMRHVVRCASCSSRLGTARLLTPPSPNVCLAEGCAVTSRLGTARLLTLSPTTMPNAVPRAG